jgi:hypothetical protein
MTRLREAAHSGRILGIVMLDEPPPGAIDPPG